MLLHNISGIEYDESYEYVDVAEKMNLEWNSYPEGMKPKYLLSDIARLLKRKIEFEALDEDEVAWELDIGEQRFKKILEGGAILLSKETKSIANFLDMSFDELTKLVPIKY